ncbi:heavy metal-binding domain-containing protein [Desulfovibrio sp. OttesenSCG-928-C14]|nr:heavy metal-binding domain-containing protein [Desulfovibrio sp. OttesenSCG-928-C14]
MAKKFRLGGKRPTPDCQASISTRLKTEDGFEDVQINMATGEITYGPGKCTLPEEALRRVCKDAGYDLEEVK